MEKYSTWLIRQIMSGNINEDEQFANAIKERSIEEKMEAEHLKNKICPNCNRLRLYHRGTWNNWRCSKCKSLFSIDMKYLGLDF